MNDIIIGIDIGTSSIKIIASEYDIKKQKPYILHTIESPSYGLRNGYIIDINKVSSSLKLAIKKIEQKLKQKVKYARFSIGGVGLVSNYVRVNIEIDTKEDEIRKSDIINLIKKSEQLFTQKYPNKKILHVFPIKYFVDKQIVLGNPIGLFGSNLEAKIIFITIPEHHYNSFKSVIENSNIYAQDIIASPVADSKSSISYNKKLQGSILVNIGSETTSLSTFENGNITSVKVTNIGSNDITNDIALGLQITLEEADGIKKTKNIIASKQKVREIIYARFSDIIDIIEKHLISINKNSALPAGIIFSGGGSLLENILEITKKNIQLPTDIVSISKYSLNTKRNSNIGPKFSVAYGLCFIDMEVRQNLKLHFNLKKIKYFIKNLFRQLMP